MKPAQFLMLLFSVLVVCGCFQPDVISPVARVGGGDVDDPLKQLVGDWKLDVTSKKAPWTPKEIRYDVTDHAEFILDGKFLQHIEVNRLQDGSGQIAKSLYLRNYDETTKKYVSWGFQSNGNMNQLVGTWDAETQTLQYTNAEDLGNITSTVTEVFEDDGTLDGSLIFEDTKKNEKQFDMVWIRTRLKGADAEKTKADWKFAGKPIKPIPQQVKRLHVFVGDWNSTYRNQPSVSSPKGGIFKTKTKGEWILDGRFMMGSSLSGKYKTVWVMGYDDKQNAYRYVRFDNEGLIEEVKGEWDEASKTFEWTRVNGPADVTKNSSSRVKPNGEIHTHILETKADGKILCDMTIESRAVKK